MAQPVRTLAAKPRNMSSFLGPHMVERTNLPQMSSDLHGCVHVHNEPNITFNNVEKTTFKEGCRHLLLCLVVPRW